MSQMDPLKDVKQVAFSLTHTFRLVIRDIPGPNDRALEPWFLRKRRAAPSVLHIHKDPWIRIHGIYGKISSKKRMILGICQSSLFLIRIFIANRRKSRGQRLSSNMIRPLSAHHFGEHKSRISASTRKTTGFRMAKPPGCTCDDFLAWPKTFVHFV